MSVIEVLRNHDLPSVYNEGAPTRSKTTCCTPTNPGNKWLHQGWKYHKQLQDRQDKAVQYVNIQDALYCWLPRHNSEVWDNRLVQYANGMSCCLNTEFMSDSCRASLRTAYPSYGMSCPTKITTLWNRLPTKKATHNSLTPCSKVWPRSRFHPPPRKLIKRKSKVNMTAIGCLRSTQIPEALHSGSMKTRLITHSMWVLLYCPLLNTDTSIQIGLLTSPHRSSVSTHQGNPIWQGWTPLHWSRLQQDYHQS